MMEIVLDEKNLELQEFEYRILFIFVNIAVLCPKQELFELDLYIQLSTMEFFNSCNECKTECQQ